MCDTLSVAGTVISPSSALHYGGGSAEEKCVCPMPCKQNVFTAGVSYAGFRTTYMHQMEPEL